MVFMRSNRILWDVTHFFFNPRKSSRKVLHTQVHMYNTHFYADEGSQVQIEHRCFCQSLVREVEFFTD